MAMPDVIKQQIWGKKSDEEQAENLRQMAAASLATGDQEEQLRNQAMGQATGVATASQKEADVAGQLPGEIGASVAAGQQSMRSQAADALQGQNMRGRGSAMGGGVGAAMGEESRKLGLQQASYGTEGAVKQGQAAIGAAGAQTEAAAQALEATKFNRETMLNEAKQLQDATSNADAIVQGTKHWYGDDSGEAERKLREAAAMATSPKVAAYYNGMADKVRSGWDF